MVRLALPQQEDQGRYHPVKMYHPLMNRVPHPLVATLAIFSW